MERAGDGVMESYLRCPWGCPVRWVVEAATTLHSTKGVLVLAMVSIY